MGQSELNLVCEYLCCSYFLPNKRTFSRPNMAECVEYRGYRFPATTVKDLEFAGNELQVLDDDVFNVTYPKSGTTWMIEILSLIHTNGDPTWSKETPNWSRVPWIEIQDSEETIKKIQDRRRYLSSHLPRQLFCKSFTNSKAKVIYTARHPKDVAVSFYHFSKINKFFAYPESFDDFLKNFLSGNLPYGSWFDHVKGWLELVGTDNFLFNTYEDLQKDLRGTLKRICAFIGKELDEAALDSVMENVSFHIMKDNRMANFSLVPEKIMDQTQNRFMRKGIAGDWKNHFTVAQSEYFDKVFKEKMADIGVKLPWD
ncbi:hypothetical protein XENTR_v10019431 [Xenopus tropicalis]|nr:uncharacterized protein LOC100144919 isoform X1 [Xenopus tropicalis]KAE8594057.1 hypothetical protein XENTR_v10019431 [Xenopus tropicalis]|eukprot:XP_012821496.1 PREDICTED: uncharacterized protein LOC100144919 isoform X1 [Xenopus tropicalis]